MQTHQKPYYEQIALAKRWDKVVDFGSPMSAWSSAMFEEYDRAKKENRLPRMVNCKKSGD